MEGNIEPHINGQAQQQERFITLFLVKSDNIKRKIRCIDCGYVILEQTGKKVTDILEGAFIEHETPCDIMCHRCKTKYRVL